MHGPSSGCPPVFTCVSFFLPFKVFHVQIACAFAFPAFVPFRELRAYHAAAR
jgi:hypothetical protein